LKYVDETEASQHSNKYVVYTCIWAILVLCTSWVLVTCKHMQMNSFH